MAYVVIDFETHDPYFDRGLGAGWVFKCNNIQGNDFEVLGAAYKLSTTNDIVYTTNVEEIKKVVEEADYLIMHNAQYDLGCLHSLGVSVKDKKVFDTVVMTKLYDSTRMTYSLDSIAKDLFRKQKDEKYLADAVWEHNLYPLKKSEENKLAKCAANGIPFTREKPEEKKLIKFAKSNMKLIQNVAFDNMANYAKGDVLLTEKLYLFLKEHVDLKLAEWYSFMAHICIDYRLRGVRVDLDKAREASVTLGKDLEEAEDDLFKFVGNQFNYNSIIELPAVFENLGISYPKTDKGNPSITSPWLKTIDHPIAEKLLKIKKLGKIKNDFIDKVLEMQQYTLGINSNNLSYGRLFPELNILAANTGRFSSTCPNIQQIPKVDHDNPDAIANLVRELYVPEQGETWYSLDFSNQEGRLQTHYAYKFNCEGSDILKLEFDKEPTFDLHQKVADIAQITRKEAKTINLGISYGMGRAKLGKALKLNDRSTKLLLQKYNNLMPYLSKLNDICKYALKTRGYIKTIMGRHVHLDKDDNDPDKDFSYKALNKLIQGSAADQTMLAMRLAYEQGLKILFPVHDELNMSSANFEDALKLKKIMETCLVLDVPMYTEIGQGKNWAEAK